MKILYVISTFILIAQISFAQIGIYTQSLLPESIFQIDPLNNSTPSGTGLDDDMIVTYDDDGVMLGLGNVASNSMQLNLNSTKKALKLNEVALLSSTDIVTVPSPTLGMIVYNTTSDLSKDLEVGLCYFDGTKWNKILDFETSTNLKNEFSISYVAQAQTEIPTTTYAKALSGIYSDAKIMNFKNSTTSQIKAPTLGTYVFAMRFYSFSPAGSALATYNKQEVLFFFLVSKTKNKLLNKTVVTFPYTANRQIYYSYRLVMGATLDANEEVEFYVARGTSPDFDDCPLYIRILDNGTNIDTKSAARTSLVFWKL